MQIQRIGYGIRGFYRIAALGHLWEMTPKDAQNRLKILTFFSKHGMAATLDAFDVSRRTLYRWKAMKTQGSDNPAALDGKSCVPHRKRQPGTSSLVVRQIRDLRRQYPNLGKAKLHVLLTPWCHEQGLPIPSASTIGRIIARATDKMRHTPHRIGPKGQQKTLRRGAQARKPKGLESPPMGLWAVDTIERARDGMRRYLMSFIDPVSRIGLAVALPTKSSANTAKALDALLQGFCIDDASAPTPRSIAFLSDNGSEFKGCFDALLHRHQITHYWTYPRCPKMNAHNERFNRTLQEQFVDYHDDLLFTDINAFNSKLAQWIVQYNTIIPHHSLNMTPPLLYLLNKHPQCQRYWTHTKI